MIFNCQKAVGSAGADASSALTSLELLLSQSFASEAHQTSHYCFHT